ncbi:MAG: T9SS type A sorting domain-containing protein [Bacteroidales bacterium]
MQVSYETFGCNDGNVFFMGIDHGNTNEAVFEFDSIYGVHYPGISGLQGGGNAVHLQYNIMATPTIVVITPDKLIANQQISPPSTTNVVAAITSAGGIQQSCLTTVDLAKFDDILTLGPNPVTNELTIYIDKEIELSKVDVRIISSHGEMVFKKTYVKLTQPAIRMNVSSLKTGIYIVEVCNGSTLFVRHKILISR